MNFDLNQAPDQEVRVEVKYQQPGIFENVKVTEVQLGLSSFKQSPYMELHTIGEDGSTGKSNKMYLGTEVAKNEDGTPKKTSGWGVTSNNLINMLIATHNTDRESAKSMINVTSKEELASKVSALLVGKPFRAKFRGEQGTRGNTIFATLDLVESMKIPKTESKLRFDASRDIKYQPQAPTQELPNDMPF